MNRKTLTENAVGQMISFPGVGHVDIIAAVCGHRGHSGKRTRFNFQTAGYILFMKDGQYHYSTTYISKDESLWSSQKCLIRTHHNYPLPFLKENPTDN